MYDWEIGHVFALDRISSSERRSLYKSLLPCLIFQSVQWLIHVNACWSCPDITITFSYWGSTLKMPLGLKYWGLVLGELAILYSENNFNSFDFDYFGAKGNQLLKILDEKNFFVFQTFNKIHVQVGFLFVVHFVTTFLHFDTHTKSHCCIHLFH